jgi:hypothetical protein
MMTSLVDCLSCWIRPVTKISLLCAKQRPHIPSVDLLLSQHIRGRRRTHRFCNEGCSSCNERVPNEAEPRDSATTRRYQNHLYFPAAASQRKLGLLAAWLSEAPFQHTSIWERYIPRHIAGIILRPECFLTDSVKRLLTTRGSYSSWATTVICARWLN